MKKERLKLMVMGLIIGFIGGTMLLPQILDAGSMEPTAPPGPTMKTLDEIPPTWSQKLPSSNRFELVLDDAAVLDKETGLVWAKDANIFGGVTWQNAMEWCRGLSIADRKGWRLPTVEEFATLIDMSVGGSPKLPSGHPFTNVQPSYYWSGTTHEGDSTKAYFLYLGNGNVSTDPKTLESYVWPVRGGQ